MNASNTEIQIILNSPLVAVGIPVLATAIIFGFLYVMNHTMVKLGLVKKNHVKAMFE